MSSSTPAATKRNARAPSTSSGSSLSDRLAAVLPQGHKFGIHHISTPPTRTEPLCAAPPGHRPDKTYRESHFLAISIQPRQDNAAPPLKCASPGADQGKGNDAAKHRQTLVFAVEVFIFTTAYQTTLFVSKADSTGYLHLLNLPKGSPSPIRQVCAAFFACLLDHRRRKHVQSVVNLFARAQAQYLFPGSVRNPGKHVLDDWGLVRWWCKVLNPLMEGLSNQPWGKTKGYLLVPGLEKAEMRAFIPRTPASAQNWEIGHPLERISHYARDLDHVPPRCLIPGYPDDPKSRFRDELDEEVSKQKQGITAWKSVRSLDQFWEMMAFRQECSSGRLTGFIWLVFDPPESDGSPSDSPPSAAAPAVQLPSTVTKKKKKKKLSGRIVPRIPKIKKHARNHRLDRRPVMTAYYYWPSESRGDKIVDETEYKRIVELLLHLDFSTLDKAVGSSQRWLGEVGMGGGVDGVVVGSAVVPDSLSANGGVSSAASGKVTNLTGLIRRKDVSQTPGTDTRQRVDSVPKMSEASTGESSATQQINVLGANLMRKKKRNAEDADLQSR
ncbi:histone acetylation protein-domain-containing protein [Achaetomium macrosporum]|uniref:histone acetyltransferase n=1 Tax=Achaetomium macrosporum TaxID=79813 RepID=A0AAN7HDF0_9PEZI|nr:histone acetylation protein-domain-containing protein [Achaetomium macrosporum]